MLTGTEVTGIGWMGLTLHDATGVLSCFTLHTGVRVASVLMHKAFGRRLVCGNTKSESLDWWTGELSPFIRNCKKRNNTLNNIVILLLD